MNTEQVRKKLVAIIGDTGREDWLVECVIKLLTSDDPTGAICYSSIKLGNRVNIPLYWGHDMIVFGDCTMPGGNGGPSSADQDITDDLLGRVRTCSYRIRIDSGG